MRTLTLLLAGSIVTCGTFAQTTDPVEPQKLIERTIDAHGGKDKLTQVRADWVKIKGHLILEGKEVPFVSDTWVQMPGQFKNIIELTRDNKTTRLVQILNKDRVHMTINGQPHTASPAAIEEIRETLHLNNAIRLMPLLAEGDTYRLDSTGEMKDQDRVLQGLKVSMRGRKDLRLYFDKATGLLVRTEQTRDDGNGKEFRQETVYLDFRDLAGYKRPVKMAVYREGKKLMEAELVEVKYHDKLADAIFQP